MECLHCRRDLKYKERSNRRCSKCKQEFVFEPRENALYMSDRRLRAITQRVSANGKLVYTPEQLVFYAMRGPKGRTMDRKTKAAHRIAMVVISTVVVSIVILAMTMDIELAGVILALGLLMAWKAVDKVGVGLNDILEAMVEIARPILRTGARRAPVRALPWEEANFLQNVHNRWPDVYGALPSGLLHQESSVEDWSEAPSIIRAVLVCPDHPVLRCLHANGVPNHLGLALLSTSSTFTKGEQATLAALQREPAIPLLLLHDADPDGLMLAETVRATLGLDPRNPLIDIGLRPRDAMKHDLMKFYQIPSTQAIARFRERAAHKQAAISPGVRLDETELKWLEEGNYSPVRALTPKQLIGTVTTAVERATRAVPRRVDEARPEHQARALGFLTWPE